MRERGYIGANVTVPHKQAVMALSEPDERAKAVGAANCLWFDDGKLRSTNTDVDGFLANLDAVTPGWDRGLETAAVLGAGGGARAVVYGLIQRNVGRIYVINRTAERARSLEKEIRRARARRQVGGEDWPARRRRAAGQHHHLGHGRAAAVGDQFALPGLAGGGGSGLCAAGNRRS